MAPSLSPGALFLAIETSGSLGSVAVGAGATVLARAFLDRQGRHAAELIPTVSDVLGEAGVGVGELNGIVVGSGPGSFTGVRVAAATGKGLAHALGVPLWAFSSLEAAAVADQVLPAPSGLRRQGRVEGVRFALFDARGDRVYAACYAVGPGRVEELVPPRATRLGEILDGEVPDGSWFVGDGALRHEPALNAAGHRVLPPPAGVPTADALLHLFALRPGDPVERADRWEPQYVKASSAERARVG